MRISDWISDVGSSDLRDRGGGAGRKSKGDRRREVLKRLALFGAAGVSGEKARDLGQHRQRGGGRSGLGAKGRAELAQEQDRRRLAGVVGGLPVPGTGGVGGAEDGLHRGTQHERVADRTSTRLKSSH